MWLFNKKRKKENMISDLARSMVEYLGYTYKVFPKGMAYKQLEEEYLNAALRGREEGFTPVLVRVDSVLDEMIGVMKDDGYDVREVLKEGADAEAGKRFLEERFEGYFNETQNDLGMSLEEFAGDYNGKTERLTGFTAVFDLSNQTEETILFEVPTTNPWEVVAYIPFGGWNECPAPADMVNALKYWFDKYGAVPATITHDTLELSVPAPINETSALELAKEHFSLCPDRVYQGTNSGTLSEVAESLKVSTVWFFWWD